MDDVFEFENGEELCCHDGVILKKCYDDGVSVGPEVENIGTLSLVKYNDYTYYVEWKQNRFLIADSDAQEQDDWSLVDKISRRNRTESETLIFNMGLTGQELKLQADSANPNIVTTQPTTSKFNSTRTVRCALGDLKYFELLHIHNELQLVTTKDTIHSQYFFQQRNADLFLRVMLHMNLVRQNQRNKKIYKINHDRKAHEMGDVRRSFDSININEIKNSKAGGGVINDFLIKIGEFIPPMVPIPSSPPDSPVSRDATVNNSEEYEVLNRSDSGSVDPAEQKIKDQESKLHERRKCNRGSRLTEKIWRESQTEDGRVSDVDHIKDLIFHGGIDNHLRRDVWKYLLGYEAWECTHDERRETRTRKKDEYFQMKFQWKSITKTQEDNFSGYRDRKCQIEKDVKRTDRTEIFFAGDNNPNLDLLQDILMTYVMYNFDLGYVQGMSDLLAPILYVMKNEQDSFWCFVGFMQKVYSNFDIDQAGMKKQLLQLSQLLSFVCPRLHYYLKKTSSENMFFCFRWLLVWFKREFSQLDIMELWESLWTGLPCENFHLILCVAILEMQMDIFIDNKYEFNDIIKHINDLSLKIDLRECLENAESIYQQIKDSVDKPNEIRIIIGEEPLEEQLELDSSNVENKPSPSCSPKILKPTPTDDQRKLEELCELSMNYSFL